MQLYWTKAVFEDIYVFFRKGKIEAKTKVNAIIMHLHETQLDSYFFQQSKLQMKKRKKNESEVSFYHNS